MYGLFRRHQQTKILLLENRNFFFWAKAQKGVRNHLNKSLIHNLMLLTDYKDQVVVVRHPFHTILLILNMIFPGVGTILNAFCDWENGVKWVAVAIGIT